MAMVKAALVKTALERFGRGLRPAESHDGQEPGDAVVIPPPADFAAKIPGGPKGMFGLDPTTGAPLTWPIPGFIGYWGAVIRGLKPGKYDLYARAINRNGDAQPLPRPFDVSGPTRVPSAAIEITA